MTTPSPVRPRPYLYDHTHLQSSDGQAALQAMAHDPGGEARAPAPLHRLTHLGHAPLEQERLKLTYAETYRNIKSYKITI